MDLLLVLSEERTLKWTEVLAQTAENFIAKNAISSSGFLNVLGQNIADELEVRCDLYAAHAQNIEDSEKFEIFFDHQEKQLRMTVSSRFGKEATGKEACELKKKKYQAILFSHQKNKPKPPIGFHCDDNE